MLSWQATERNLSKLLTHVSYFSFLHCHSLYLNDLTYSLGHSPDVSFVTGLYPLKGPATFLIFYMYFFQMIIDIERQ